MSSTAMRTQLIHGEASTRASVARTDRAGASITTTAPTGDGQTPRNRTRDVGWALVAALLGVGAGAGAAWIVVETATMSIHV